MKTQPFHRTKRAVVAVVVALALSVVLSKSYSLWDAHGSAIARAERDTQNAAGVLAEHAARTFEGVSRALAVAKELHDEIAAGRVYGAMEVHDALRTVQGNSPVIFGLGWTDAAGNRLASSISRDPPPLNIADQEHFRVHREDPNLGIHIAAPVRSRLDGTWIIAVCCRLDDRQGNFAGIVNAVLRLDYFLDFYRVINLGPDTTVTLARNDGTILARVPMIEAWLGRSLTVGRPAQGAPAGVRQMISPIDGVERIFAYEWISEFPLLISATMSRTDALAPFHEFRLSALSELAMILLALAAGGGLLVTLARRREAAARETAETTTLLQAVFAVTDQAICVFDRDLRVVAWNDLCARYFGEAVKLGRGAHLEDMLRVTAGTGEYGLGAAEAFVAERLAAARARQAVRYERTRPDGSVLDVGWLPLPNGYLALTHTDVTRIKEVEVALRESQARAAQAHMRLKDAVDSLTDPFFLWDAEERLVLANRAALTGTGNHVLVSGVTLEQALREQIRIGGFPAAIGREKEFLQERLAQIRAGSGEVAEIERADGTWMATWDHRTSEGGVVSLRVDITALKRSEKALRESEVRAAKAHERLLDAINMLKGPFFLWSADERLILANKAAQGSAVSDMLVPGVRLEDVIRRRVELGRFPAAAGREQEYLRERLATIRSATGKPSEIELSDGRWLSVQNFRTRDGGLVDLVVDITELKTRETELSEARKAADAANRAKSEFLSRMSHELRTPLNAMIGFSQVLLLAAKDPLTVRQQAYVRDIETSGRHLLRLVDDVLDLARIESGKDRMSIERVSIAEAFKGLSGAMTAIADAAGIALSVLEPATAIDVRTDGVRLHQILLNFVSNAIKYNRERGSVTVSAEMKGERVRLTVADTGLGIPQARHEDVFRPFHRLGREHSGIDGTGIGLAICKRLAEAMDGTIGFASTSEGSAFWVELPAYAETTLSAPDAEEAGLDDWEDGLRGVRLLYVEDNPSNMRLIEHLVSVLPDVTMLKASTPHLGLDLARAHRPDLILLDLHLSGMDGYEMLAHLKAMPETRDIPVMALTAAAMPEDIERGLAAGFCRYVTKPIDVKEFFTGLFECLSESGDESEKPQAVSSARSPG